MMQIVISVASVKTMLKNIVYSKDCNKISDNDNKGVEIWNNDGNSCDDS
jgi:hypothetical protein